MDRVQMDRVQKMGNWLRAVVGAVMAVVLLATGSALASSTLCIGSDGHVALESRSGDRCLDRAAPDAKHDPEVLQWTDVAPCCGPCTDVSASPLGWTSSKDLRVPQPVVLPLLRFSAQGMSPQAAAESLLRRAGAADVRVSPPLSSVSILRC